jgi:hypothetical protein
MQHPSNSCTLTDFGNEMQANRISMNEIAAVVRQASTPLRQNPENMVWVFDIEHLTGVIVNGTLYSSFAPRSDGILQILAIL